MHILPGLSLGDGVHDGGGASKPPPTVQVLLSQAEIDVFTDAHRAAARGKTACLTSQTGQNNNSEAVVVLFMVIAKLSLGLQLYLTVADC